MELTNVGVTTSKVGVVTFTTSGNLILAGTVDGRDVAADGSNQDDLTLTGVYWFHNSWNFHWNYY